MRLNILQIIFAIFILASTNSCERCNEKQINYINIIINDYSSNNISQKELKQLLNLVDCKTEISVPFITLIKKGYKDTMTVKIDYGNIIDTLFELDAESVQNLYNVDKLSYNINNKTITNSKLESFLQFHHQGPLEYNSDTSYLNIIVGNVQQLNYNNSNILNIPNTDSLIKSIPKLICNKSKKLNIIYIGKSHIDTNENKPILDSLEAIINNPLDFSKNTQLLETHISDLFDSGIGDWRLYYLRSRVLCLNKPINYENLAVNDLAIAGRIALNLNSSDSLLSKINALISSDFKELFRKDKLYRARLDGTLAGLKNKNTDLIDVPLYYLSSHPIPGFQKSIPLIHFEKKIPYKTYVSLGLKNEILIQIINYNETSGLLKINISDRKTKVPSFHDIELGNGIIFKASTNNYFIRNLTDSSKPFITISLEDYNNQESFKTNELNKMIQDIDAKIKNTSNTNLQTQYLNLKIQLKAYQGIGISNEKIANFKYKLQNIK